MSAISFHAILASLAGIATRIKSLFWAPRDGVTITPPRVKVETPHPRYLFRRFFTDPTPANNRDHELRTAHRRFMRPGLKQAWSWTRQQMRADLRAKYYRKFATYKMARCERRSMARAFAAGEFTGKGVPELQAA